MYQIPLHHRNEAQTWKALAKTALQAAVRSDVWTRLESMPVAGKEKTRCASSHDMTLIRDVA